MKRPFFQTLSARWTVLYVFLVFAVLVLYAGWTSVFLLHNLFLQLDLRLDRGLESIVRSITVGPDGAIGVNSGSQKEYLLEIWSADGVLLYRSSSLEAQALGPAPSSNDLQPRSSGPTRLTWTSTGNKSIHLANGTRVRIAVRQYQLGNQLLVVRLGENEAFLWHEFGEMLSVLAVGLPVALVIVGVTGYSLARHARIEAERRIARDMEIAKQVQARLFPQKIPTLETLEYAGRCIQARDVGGDYYDFLNLGVGRTGIVLADVVGKGIPGALLMANLQADVRSHCAIASQDLPQFLKLVNQSFFESSDEGRYATLFFGDYQDSTRHLRFGNCGHNPPLLVHRNGTAERLTATATVLGLFENWESSLGDVQIAPGDVLVIYTDGVIEADNSDGEEFGEGRLLEIVRHHLSAPVHLILDAILRGALEFSGGEGKMRDDLTLVVARGR